MNQEFVRVVVATAALGGLLIGAAVYQERRFIASVRSRERRELAAGRSGLDPKAFADAGLSLEQYFRACAAAALEWSQSYRSFVDYSIPERVEDL